MDLRPCGPTPALALLVASALLLWAAVAATEAANPPYDLPPEHGLLAVARVCYMLSLVAGIASLVAWLLRRPDAIPTPADGAPLSPGVGLALTAQAFVRRLHRVMQLVGGLVLAGGLGLVAAASLVADGTKVSPFQSLPGRVGVVRLNNWQSEATFWAFVLLGLAVAYWWGEYRWVRRLRRDWLAPPPEV